MITASDDDWRGLLLHRLPADEAARLECKLLADDGALAALRDAEIDLHDDYARLQLTADEHRAFRRHVLTSPQAEARQRLSQAMKPLPPEVRRAVRFETVARPRSRRGLRTALTGVAIAVGLLTAIKLFQPDLLSSTTRKPVSAASTAAEPTLLLLAIDTAEAPRPEVRVVLRRGASGLRVQAEVTHAEEARLYRLRLLGDDGETKPLLDIDGLPLQTVNGYRFVETLLPAKLLAGGARTLQVDSLPPAGSFSDRWTIRARTTDEPPFALPSP